MIIIVTPSLTIDAPSGFNNDSDVTASITGISSYHIICLVHDKVCVLDTWESRTILVQRHRFRHQLRAFTSLVVTTSQRSALTATSIIMSHNR